MSHSRSALPLFFTFSPTHNINTSIAHKPNFQSVTSSVSLALKPEILEPDSRFLEKSWSLLSDFLIFHWFFGSCSLALLGWKDQISWLNFRVILIPYRVSQTFFDICMLQNPFTCPSHSFPEPLLLINRTPVVALPHPTSSPRFPCNSVYP